MGDERQAIIDTFDQLIATMELSDAAPALKTVAALMVAAEFARRTEMPIMVAASMLADFMAKGPLK